MFISILGSKFTTSLTLPLNGGPRPGLRPCLQASEAWRRSRRFTLTGLGSLLPRRPNCSAMLMTTFPPKLCPISNSGNSFSRPSRRSTSPAAVSTPCGPDGRRGCRADSPWQRRSTSRICHEGNACQRHIMKFSLTTMFRTHGTP